MTPVDFCPDQKVNGKEKEFVLKRTIVDEDELHVRIKEYIKNLTLENIGNFSCHFIVKVTEDNKKLVENPNAQNDCFRKSEVWLSPDNYGSSKDVKYFFRSNFTPSCCLEMYDNDNEYLIEEERKFDPQILYFIDWVNISAPKFGQIRQCLKNFMNKCSEDFEIGINKLTESNPEINSRTAYNDSTCYSFVAENKDKFHLTDLQLEFLEFLSKLDHDKRNYYLLNHKIPVISLNTGLISFNKRDVYTNMSCNYHFPDITGGIEFLEKVIPADIPYKDEYIAVLRTKPQSSVVNLHKMLVEKVQELYAQTVQDPETST